MKIVLKINSQNQLKSPLCSTAALPSPGPGEEERSPYLMFLIGWAFFFFFFISLSATSPEYPRAPGTKNIPRSDSDPSQSHLTSVRSKRFQSIRALHFEARNQISGQAFVHKWSLKEQPQERNGIIIIT